MSEQAPNTNEKLSRALLSFGIVVFAFFVLLILNDLWSDQEYYLPDSFLIFVVFGIFAAPLLVWHVFDLLDRSGETSSVLRRVSSLRIMAYFTLGPFILHVAMLFGLGYYNSCDELDGALFHSCKIGTSLWVVIPFVTLGGVAWLLAFIKAILSIVSRLRGSPDPTSSQHPITPAQAGT